MFKTLEWIQWLLERGWKIHFSNKGLGLEAHWEWTNPNGRSGKEFWSDKFDVLPPKVVEFIEQANPPMTIAKER